MINSIIQNIVSRADPRLIEELFKREVPEISSGTVEIKKAPPTWRKS